MDKAILVNPAKLRGGQEKTARQLNQAEVDRYKRLGLVFACACNQEKWPDAPALEMEWRGTYRWAGRKTMREAFAAVAGTAQTHEKNCRIYQEWAERQDKKKKHPPVRGPSINQQIAQGWPVLAYLDIKQPGHVPYNHVLQTNLARRHPDLGLARRVPSVDQLMAESANRCARAPIKSWQNLTSIMEKMVSAQEGSLSRLLISQGGGVRSVVGTYFNPADLTSIDPDDHKKAHRLRREARSIWGAIGARQQELQASGQTKNLPILMAMHPVLMRLLPSQQERDRLDRRAGGHRALRGENSLALRGLGQWITDAGGNFTHEIIAPDVATRGLIEQAWQKGTAIYAVATPIVTRKPNETEYPADTNLCLHVIPGMCGGLAPVLEYALRQPYVPGDWKKTPAAVGAGKNVSSPQVAHT